jgi:uncharacterized protein
MKELPVFKYHPDPILTGMIIKTGAACECCGHANGYMCKRPIYAADEIETICPWCVADGSAAEKFDGVFVDDHPLLMAKLPAEIIDEVSKRTPGYESWQEASWVACCGDACEFHGDESREYLQALDQDGLLRVSKETRFPFDVLKDVIAHYQPGGSPAFYRFLCRHCGAIHHHADFH